MKLMSDSPSDGTSAKKEQGKGMFVMFDSLM